MVGIYGAIYRFSNILLMCIYRKATKVQVKIVLKTSLEHILSTMILILIYLPRHFFLNFVWPVRKSLSVKLRLIQKPVHWFALQISYLFLYDTNFTERSFQTDVSILIYVRCFESNSIFTEIKQNHYVFSPVFVLCK